MSDSAPDGPAPDRSPVALLLIDVINDFEHEDGECLFEHALPASEQIAALTQRARAEGIPVLYTNDNFGRWRDDFDAVVAHCLRPEARGQAIVERLQPEDGDYFVLKPKHSAFFATSLELLLDHLGAETLVLCGFACDICVLATALDAYMRDYHLVIPSDTTASVETEETSRTLAYARRVLDAETPPAEQVDFGALQET
jgi:nicotinamidase-related amidase